MFHRLTFVFLTVFLFFVSISHAQFPACAQGCLGQANPGSCSLTDNACLCNNSAYTNPTNNCFRTSCSATDWKAAYNYAVLLCNEAGVTRGNVVNPPPPKRTFTPVYFGRRRAVA